MLLGGELLEEGGGEVKDIAEVGKSPNVRKGAPERRRHVLQ